MSEKKEESSDDEEQFEEEFIETITKSGVLEKKKEGDKKHKFCWYLLIGGTLFEYRTIKDKDPKETYQLKGCEVVLTTVPISTTFELRKGSKTLLTLLPQSEESRDEWVSAIRSSLDKEPSKPPVREKAKRGTISMRMKKAVGGKLAISSAGKFMAKSSVPEEIQRLINSLRAIMTTHLGEEAASDVEDSIIKLYVKCFCLEQDGVLKLEEFVAMDQPMREAFAAISKLRDQTVIRKGTNHEQIDEAIKKIREHLRVTEAKLTELLTPHLKPHSISKIEMIFKHINNAQFLKKAIVIPLKGEAAPGDPPFLDDDIDNLCSAMDKYLSVPFYQEERES